MKGFGAFLSTICFLFAIASITGSIVIGTMNPNWEIGLCILVGALSATLWSSIGVIIKLQVS